MENSNMENLKELLIITIMGTIFFFITTELFSPMADDLKHDKDSSVCVELKK